MLLYFHVVHALWFYCSCVVSYCGHGTGRKYYLTKEMDELDCRAICIQMGCKTGKLEVQY